MSLILGIETSTTVCSVALVQNGQTLAIEKLFLEKSHSTLLTLVIENLLSHTDKQMSDLSAVAVAKGPGSYTGLRIGVSTAKGLCYALGIPLIGVNTLLAMVAEVSAFNVNEALLCPMLDARRMEVYTALYTHDLQEKEATKALILDETSFQETLATHRVLFFGNGAAKFESLVKQNTNACFIEEVSPSAELVAKLAFKPYDKNEFEDVAYFEPFYLKDFIATKPKKRL